MSKQDGYLEVADFITVVRYSKEDYPKGIKYYHVKQNGDEAGEEEPVKSEHSQSDKEDSKSATS
jgi:hypothetical protein